MHAALGEHHVDPHVPGAVRVCKVPVQCGTPSSPCLSCTGLQIATDIPHQALNSPLISVNPSLGRQHCLANVSFPLLSHLPNSLWYHSVWQVSILWVMTWKLTLVMNKLMTMMPMFTFFWPRQVRPVLLPHRHFMSPCSWFLCGSLRGCTPTKEPKLLSGIIRANYTRRIGNHRIAEIYFIVNTI